MQGGCDREGIVGSEVIVVRVFRFTALFAALGRFACPLSSLSCLRAQQNESPKFTG